MNRNMIFLLAALVLLAGCNRHRGYPGFSYVEVPKAEKRNFVDFNSTKFGDDGLASITFLQENADGTYMIGSLQSDCEEVFRLTGATSYDKSERIVKTIPADYTERRLEENPEIATVVRSACQRAGRVPAVALQGAVDVPPYKKTGASLFSPARLVITDRHSYSAVKGAVVVTLNRFKKLIALQYPDGRRYVLQNSLGEFPDGFPVMTAVDISSEFGLKAVSVPMACNGHELDDGCEKRESKKPVTLQIDVAQLADINHDGAPELLVVREFADSRVVNVISLRQDGPVEVYEGEASNLVDLDKDGAMEIKFYDGMIGAYCGGGNFCGASVPVILSANADGVYVINTLAFHAVLDADYREALKDWNPSTVAEEESDKRSLDFAAVDLFSRAYLLGRHAEAFSYLGYLRANGFIEKPLSDLQEYLQKSAPDVLQRQEWKAVRARFATL